MDLEPEELDRDIVKGFRWAFSADETYRAVVEHLMEKDPDIELWGLYFNGVDVVEHRYWKFNEPAAYRPFDPAEVQRLFPDFEFTELEAGLRAAFDATSGENA